jgi:hypothetical protein
MQVIDNYIGPTVAEKTQIAPYFQQAPEEFLYRSACIKNRKFTHKDKVLRNAIIKFIEIHIIKGD